MSILKQSGIWVTILSLLFAFISPSQAAMIDNSEAITESNRAQLVSLLEREDVQAQMVAMGVDPDASLARVDQMTNQEVTQLNGQINQLIAGAGVSTVELLLIIILVVLIL